MYRRPWESALGASISSLRPLARAIVACVKRGTFSTAAANPSAPKTYHEDEDIVPRSSSPVTPLGLLVNSASVLVAVRTAAEVFQGAPMMEYAQRFYDELARLPYVTRIARK